MKRMTLTKHAKDYLIRMYQDYEYGRLTLGEEAQLFQDLYDTGLLWQLNPDVRETGEMALRVGYIVAKDASSKKPSC